MVAASANKSVRKDGLGPVQEVRGEPEEPVQPERGLLLQTEGESSQTEEIRVFRVRKVPRCKYEEEKRHLMGCFCPNSCCDVTLTK